MDESQESFDKLYDSSCPETDEICAIARSNGVYCARLTGIAVAQAVSSLVVQVETC